jgi:hypothetical protein
MTKRLHGEVVEDSFDMSDYLRPNVDGFVNVQGGS